LSDPREIPVKKKTEDAKGKGVSKTYSKPKMKKHANLKEITLLSFNPPKN
jgi:hypothetical protein